MRDRGVAVVVRDGSVLVECTLGISLKRSIPRVHLRKWWES